MTATIASSLRFGLERLLGIEPPRAARVPSHHVVESSPADVEAYSPLVLTPRVWSVLRRTIGSAAAETGGVLGGSRRTGVISHIEPDRGAATTRATYSPDVAAVNALITGPWKADGVDFVGFVHSHPAGFVRPSSGDQVYAHRILQAMPSLPSLRLPIVQSAADTPEFTVNGYTAYRDASGVSMVEGPVVKHRTAGAVAHQYRSRTRDAYDPEVMATARIVAVGVGGSVSFLEDMARAGVGEFVLIDPDVVEPQNIGTQHVWPRDIGRPKVAATARRLIELNPTARVWTVKAKDSALSDHAFRTLVFAPMPGRAEVPVRTLLCAFTDTFTAQARIARLGLHLGVPCLSAAVYLQGRGIELTFAAIGLTSACTRCCLGSRYRAYEADSDAGKVTSHGTPILATTWLNAAKQLIALTLLHHDNPMADPSHPAARRYGAVARRISNRNLVMGRLDPDIAESIGVRSFARLDDCDGALLGDLLWLPQTPDDGVSYPVCPDCGGTGDLSSCLGRFVDTRTHDSQPCGPRAVLT